MTDTDDPVMEMRPRCLVIVPGLSFEEFQERVWNPIKATHESLNFLLGDALVYCDVFGEQSSQLFDESLTPARMAQLKWVAEVTPPARRRDDCNWTMHRLVAGLFNRRRGIFPAAYLDRKAELQDLLLARAAAEGWHTDSMKTAIADLEKEALGERGEYLSNGGPALDESHRAGPGDSDESPDGEDEGIAADELDAVMDAAEESAPIAVIEAERQLDSSPALHTPRSGDTSLSPDEVRACIAALRVMASSGMAPGFNEETATLSDRILRALAIPLPPIGRVPNVIASLRDGLALFPPGWRRRIEEDVDLSGAPVWRVMGLREGTQRAYGLSADLGCAVVECALAAHLSDLTAVTAASAIEPEPEPESEPQPEPSPLETAFAQLPASEAKSLRDWLIRGSVLGDPAPENDIFRPFFAVWNTCGAEPRKEFVRHLVFGG